MEFSADVDHLEDVVVGNIFEERALGFYHQLVVKTGIFGLEERFGGLLFVHPLRKLIGVGVGPVAATFAYDLPLPLALVVFCACCCYCCCFCCPVVGGPFGVGRCCCCRLAFWDCVAGFFLSSWVSC